MVIKGDLISYNCKNLISLGKIKEVKGYVLLEDCINLKSLGDLQFVEKTLNLENCSNLKDLGKLKYAKKIFLKGSGITKEYIKQFKSEILWSLCEW